MSSFARQLFATNCRLPRQQKLFFSAKHLPSTRKASTSTIQIWQRTGSSARWLGVAGGLGLGLTASAFASPVYCEITSPTGSRPPSPVVTSEPSPEPQANTEKSDPPPPPPPTSILNLYELSFGTVAGICAGVFIKKGIKAVAFFVGGVFVLLQYFNSLSLIRIDWGRASSKFENLFYTTESGGARHPPTISSLWRWLVDFLTADFQPRASFLAGLALGIRIG